MQGSLKEGKMKIIKENPVAYFIRNDADDRIKKKWLI